MYASFKVFTHFMMVVVVFGFVLYVQTYVPSINTKYRFRSKNFVLLPFLASSSTLSFPGMLVPWKLDFTFGLVIGGASKIKSFRYFKRMKLRVKYD